MLSIIVPVYNAEKYLDECIQSILSQTYSDFELLLVNDGSHDNSLKICESYMLKDSRVKVFDKENGGVSSARNLGIEMAEGNLISFCDADDVIDSHLYEILISCLEENKVDRVVGGYKYLFSDGHTLNCKPRLEDGIYYKENLLPIMIDDGTLSGFLFSGVYNSIFKKSIIDGFNIRFNQDLKYNEDSLFSFIYCLNSKSLYSLQSQTLYYYRQHEESATKKSYIKNKYENTHKILADLCIGNNLINFDEQFKRRIVTETFWEILDICKEYSVSDAVKEMNAVLKKNNISSNIKFLNPKKMNKYKKYFYYLMKYKCSYILYFSVKKLVPILSKYLSR